MPEDRRSARQAVGAIVLCGAAIAGASFASAAERPWMDKRLQPAARAAALLAEMTLDEKIATVHGPGFQLNAGFAGTIPGNQRLGIPSLRLADGPNGVGNGATGVTAFPAAVLLAASWDPELAERYGQALAREQAGKGNQVALAPTVNIVRVPHWGRAFETLGEDPYLAGRIAVAEIDGIESQGVLATVKHYAANNQETLRMSIDARVSPRALRTIYLPAFEAAVREAAVGSVMCSYNRVNGVYGCEHPWLLTEVLRKEWGYEGFVMSDWFATHSTEAAAKAGLDLEMPGGANAFGRFPEYFGDALKKAVADGTVPAAVLDEKVTRILTAMFRAGIFDRPAVGSPDAVVIRPEHQQLARAIVEQGAVLLKNAGGVLPFTGVASVALIGDAAGERAKITGGGSADVKSSRVRLATAGIADRAGASVKVTTARGTLGTAALPAIPAESLTPPSGQGHGVEATYYPSVDLTGTPAATRVEPKIEGDWTMAAPVTGLPRPWSARFAGVLAAPASGTYRFSIAGSGAARLFVDEKLVASHADELFGGVTHALVDLPGDRPVGIRVEYRAIGLVANALAIGWQPPDPALVDEAVAAAKAADVAVVFVSDLTAEGGDRTTLGLPGDQDRLVSRIAKANPKTVVVLNTGGPALMPWIDEVAAVVQVWYPGQEYGDALAAILFGDANPSGKLPTTFPAADTQFPAASPAQFPGDGTTVRYDEELLVGYRWYDAKKEKPLFPFGHGLSYTTFAYDGFTVSARRDAKGEPEATAKVKVTNSGTRAGAEVVQLYVGFPASAGEPPWQLKAFEKVRLEPGQSKDVQFRLPARAFASWDEAAKAWKAHAGAYQVAVGSSSRDIRGTGTVPAAR
jgi:beta-glucosidase